MSKVFLYKYTRFLVQLRKYAHALWHIVLRVHACISTRDPSSSPPVIRLLAVDVFSTQFSPLFLPPPPPHNPPHTTGENISFAAKAGAGLVGGALAVCIGTPFDVALVRMQADTMKPPMERRNYGGVGDALRRIGKTSRQKLRKKRNARSSWLLA